MGSTEDFRNATKTAAIKCDPEEFGPNFKVLPSNDQVKELQTILRDKYVWQFDSCVSEVRSVKALQATEWSLKASNLNLFQASLKGLLDVAIQSNMRNSHHCGSHVMCNMLFVKTG